MSHPLQMFILPPTIAGRSEQDNEQGITIMKIEPSTIQAAFEMRHRHYSVLRAWDPPYHVSCWRLAAGAFDKTSFERFNNLYEELRRKYSEELLASHGRPQRPLTASLPSMPSIARNAFLSAFWTILLASGSCLKQSRASSPTSPGHPLWPCPSSCTSGILDYSLLWMTA